MNVISIAPTSFPDHNCGSSATACCTYRLTLRPRGGTLRRIDAKVDLELVDRSDDREPKVIVREKLARELRNLFGGDGVDSPLDLFGAHVPPQRELVSPEANHSARRRLQRQRQIPFDVLLREPKLVATDRLGFDAIELGDDQIHARLDVARRRAGVDSE